ncbi:MAG: hypothetical protein WKG03_13835, partial [Telluria sp.]
IQIAKARLERNMATGGFDVHVLSARHATGAFDTMQPIVPPVIKHNTAGTYVVPEPAFRLEHHSAQALLDALYEAGLRPSSGDDKPSGTTDLAIALMKDHLEDLRRMAFGPAQEIHGHDRPQTISHNTF